MLSIVKEGQFAPKLSGDASIDITVEGATHDELMSPAAKKMAMQFRHDSACPPGFGTAGIATIGPVVVVETEAKKEGDKPGKAATRKYKTFTLRVALG